MGKFKHLDIILDADLEKVRSQYSGWSAVVGSPGRPQGKAIIFKVPHHGSKNGHCEDVTAQLLDKPISILTAYRRSHLPADSDIERISTYSDSVYLTTPASGRKPHRDSSADKLYKSSVLERVVLDGKVGQIRVRGRDQIEVEIAGPARQVA